MDSITKACLTVQVVIQNKIMNLKNSIMCPFFKRKTAGTFENRPSAFCFQNNGLFVQWDIFSDFGGFGIMASPHLPLVASVTAV